MDTTVPKSPDIPEPPPGSVVLDNRGLAWQRGVHEQDDPNRWYESGANRDLPYGRLNEDHGPLTVVYTPPPDIPTGPSCTGCGQPIHRTHGMWLDDLGRGHCPSGAKQGRNSHTTAAGRYVLHATSVMTAIRDDRLVLSLAGPAGSVDVELHHADVTALAEDLDERLTDGALATSEPADAGRHAAALSWAKGEQEVTDGGGVPVLIDPRPVPAAPEPPALAVYVVEDRDSAGVGPWHRHDQTAYPTAEAARAVVERDYGAVEWDDQLEARMPGTSTAWWRITELKLAGTQGGVR